MLSSSRLTLQCSPPPGTQTPLSEIANSTKDLAAMQRADSDPTLVMLSDWDHLTSEEYQAAERASNLDLL